LPFDSRFVFIYSRFVFTLGHISNPKEQGTLMIDDLNSAGF